MKAEVKFNEDGDPYSLKVSERHGHTVKFSMEGSTAVATSIQQPGGECWAYIDDLSRFMDYAETLPFVQAVTLDEYDSAEVPE